MAATKDTVNNRIQLNEGTRASPKTLAQIVTDINDATWIESQQGGAVILIKRSIFSNGFWLEYSNYVHAILENGCHWLQHTAGGGVIHRPYSRWETKNTGTFSQVGTQALRAGTFVMESAIDGTKPEMINSGGGRYDYPTTGLISGYSYYAVAYEINGASVIGAPGQTYPKMLGTAGSLFNKMSFIGNAFFELYPNNTYDGLLSYNTGFSLINGGSSGTVAIPNWTVVSGTNYPIGAYVDGGGVTYTVLITDLTNGGVGVWNGAFAYNAAPNQATTILQHSVRYTFATGTVPISGVKVAIVNTATVGTAQAQTVLTSNASGIASGFAVRAQGVGNTVTLRQQQRIFARGLTHDVPHVQLTLQELTATVVTPVQGVLSSLYGASEVVSGGVLTKLTLNYATKTITVNQPMPSSELYDSCRWSLFQDANLTQPDFLTLSTAAVRHFGDWNIAGTGTITGNIAATTGTITAPVNGSYTDSTGVKANINNLDPQAFGTTWVLGWMTTANYTGRNTTLPPAGWTGWTQSSGTGNSTQITLAPATEYQLFLRIPGYFAPIGPIATIDTATQTSVALPVIVDTDLVGNTLWPQTAAHTTQAAKFSYDYADQIVEYDNQTGATEYISFLAAYRALELIAKAPAMAYQLIQPLYVNGTKDGFTLPRLNPLKARMSDASTGGGILQADIAYADNQQKAFDRFLANSQNAGGFLLIPQATAGISSSTVADIRSGLALEATVATRASQASVTAIPTNPLLTTDTRLNNLDAAISTRSTLTAPQVRTELAPELARIDVAISTRLAAAAYTAPDNAGIAAIKAKTDTLNNAPTVAQIRTEMETTGGKLDTAAKKSKAAWVNTL